MRYKVTIEFSRKNAAYLERYGNDPSAMDQAIENSSRWNDGIEALDEQAAMDIFEEQVRSNEPNLIAITSRKAVEYDDGFKRSDD